MAGLMSPNKAARSSRAVPVPASSLLELTLIPTFELRHDGGPIALPRTSAHLIAFLALNPGPVSRERVCATLWPAADGPQAALRTAIWRLRSVDIVRASRTHVWLSRKLIIDVHRVHSFIRSSFDSTLSGDALIRGAESLLAAAGGILADETADWALDEQEWFRQEWLQAMDRIGEGLIEAGHSGRAVQVALAASRAEPLRESAHRLLVRVHTSQGNLIEAIRAYQRYAELLHRQLRLQPSSLMRNLMASVLQENTA